MISGASPVQPLNFQAMPLNHDLKGLCGHFLGSAFPGYSTHVR